MKLSAKSSRLAKGLTVMMMLMLMCSVLILTGCTPAGNEYYKLSSETTALDQYTFDGTISMKMTMPEELTKDMTAEEKAMMDSIKATYTGSAITATNEVSMKMDMKIGNGINVPFECKMKGNQMLMKADDMLTMLKEVGASKEEMDAAQAVLKDVTWVDMDYMATFDQMTGGALKNLDMVSLSYFMNDFMMYLKDNAYKDYSPEVFAAKDKGYEIKVTSDKFAPLAKEFVTYTLGHSAAILENAKTFVNNTDEAKFVAMGLKKADIKKALDSISADKLTMSAAQMEEVNKVIDELLAMMKGSSFSSYIGKTADKKYVQDMIMDFKFADPKNANNKTGMYMDIHMNIDGTKTVASTFPTTGIKSLADLRAGQKVTGVDGMLYLKSNTIYWTKNYDFSMLNNAGTSSATAKEVDGYNYLPMRQLAELFGETVEWDNAAAKAYVVQGDKKIEMNGFVTNGTTYVQFREFNKVGYIIGYNSTPELGGVVTFSKAPVTVTPLTPSTK